MFVKKNLQFEAEKNGVKKKKRQDFDQDKEKIDRKKAPKSEG